MLKEQDTRAVRYEATRERILKAAWKLARKDGLTGFSLRDLAKAVGMRAPSLYSYFDSKFALYDAMFAQGNRELVEHMRVNEETELRPFLLTRARLMFEFGNENVARHQLMFQRTIPGFEPSPDSYAIAVDLLNATRQRFIDAGFDDPAVLDLWTAIVSGLFSQQMANEPGGDRWLRLIDDAVDMFLDHIGYPKRKGKR